jgi:hypothetical protein
MAKVLLDSIAKESKRPARKPAVLNMEIFWKKPPTKTLKMGIW